MKGRANILAKLRRRRAGLGSLVLALFTTTNLIASATPCLAMTLTALQAPDGSTTTHDSSGSAPHQRHAHAHAAPNAAHDPAGHGPTRADTHPLSEHCPHCPLSASMTAHSGGTHQSCTVLDGVSAKAPLSASQLPLKYALATTDLEISPPSLLRPPDTPLAHAVPRAYSHVALNVRHCVFLI
jgi:hypothetical protein